MPTPTALAIVVAHYALAMLLSVAYFRRYRMPQPPLGVMNLSDVALALVCIVVVPYLHVLAPSWASTGFLALVMGGLFALLLEPMIPRRRWRWLLALAGVALGIAAPSLRPGDSHVFTTVNNALIVLAVVSIANVWVQSGASARTLVVMAMAVTVYDFVFTGRLPLTADLFARLDHRPFEPLIGWRDGPVWPAMGLGDTLMASAFVLGLYKAWGRGAAAAGLSAMLLVLPVLFLRPFFGTLFVTDAYPAMVVIGPVQWAVYAACRRRHGPERTLGACRGRAARPTVSGSGSVEQRTATAPHWPGEGGPTPPSPGRGSVDQSFTTTSNAITAPASKRMPCSS